MSVEQTTQLIQLILNSVLLTVACALTMGRLGMRRSAIEGRLQAATRRYNELKGAREMPTPDSKLLQAKQSRRLLQRQRRLTQHSLMAANYALLFSLVSLLVMTLRALVPADWLVGLALVLFVLSATLLLVGVGLTLLDIQSSRLPLGQEVRDMLRSGKPGQPAKPRKNPVTTATHRPVKPSPTRLRLPAKARVG